MFPTIAPDLIQRNYEQARTRYAGFGVDTEAALKMLAATPLSIHCWQGDDVTGFEAARAGLSGGGILATGNYPGRARDGEELRADLDLALSLIPGSHRLNLHAIYAETEGAEVDRDQLGVEHFQRWIHWARGLGLDFNPTFFSHPLAAEGFTLASRNPQIRSFWIRHGKICRQIAARISRELAKPCINNLWIPDGSKDIPADRLTPRQILKDSLDEIYAEKVEPGTVMDALESKLFGIGSEAYVVGSHEFYLSYAMKRDMMLCLDAGHFHPTESVGDKISAILTFSRELLLHLSRGVRWDSDHVVILNDDLLSIAREAVQSDLLERIHLALDFFDASINRIIAWVAGSRAALKAILFALLEPRQLLREEEARGNLGNRLALLEESKTLPRGAVWDKYCLDRQVPPGAAWLEKVQDYEERVLKQRG